MKINFASERVDYNNATRLTILIDAWSPWRDFQDFPDTDDWSVIADCMAAFAQKLRNKAIHEMIREVTDKKDG